MAARTPRIPWAEKALRDETWALKRTTDCEIEDAAYDTAFRIGQIVAGGGLAEEIAVDELMQAATASGMSWPAARDLLNRAFEQASKTPRFPRDTATPSRRLITASTWAGVTPEPRRWLWEDWIPLGTTTVLYGDGGTGKSLLAQQIATAAAACGHFLGNQLERAPAFCLFCEDDEPELMRRQADINLHLSVTMESLGDLHIMPASGEDNMLMTFDRSSVGTPTQFGDRFVAMAEGCEPGLIVVDTAADTFGGDEIRRSEVRQFITWLNALAGRTGAAVLLLAHPSLSGMSSGRGQSGSTAWTNGARSHLYLSRPKTDDDATEAQDQAERVLSRKKANYASRGEEIGIAWDRGAFVSVELPAPKAKGPKLTDAQSICLDALKRALAEAGAPSPGGPIPSGVRTVSVDLWRRYAYSMGVSGSDDEDSRRRAFFDTRKALQRKGFVGVLDPLAWLA